MSKRGAGKTKSALTDEEHSYQLAKIVFDAALAEVLAAQTELIAAQTERREWKTQHEKEGVRRLDPEYLQLKQDEDDANKKGWTMQIKGWMMQNDDGRKLALLQRR